MAGANFTNQLVLYSSGGYTRAIAGDSITEAAAFSLGSTLNVDGASTMAAITADGDLAIQDSSGSDKFTVAASSGNTVVAGTIGVTGAADLSSTLSVGGDLDVAGTKFTVAASSGNTAIAGSLAVTSHLEVGVGPKMSVNASSGNLATTGSGDFQAGLSAAGGAIVLDADASNSVILRAEASGSDVDMLTADHNGITLGSDLMLHGMTEHQILHAGSSGLVEGDNNFYFDGTDFKVGGVSSPKFSVAVSSGNVATSGDLSVAGSATITGNLTVSGTTTTVDTATLLIQDNLIISNSSPASAADGGFLTKMHPADWGADAGLSSFTVKSWDDSAKELTVEAAGSSFGSVSVDEWKDRVIYDDNGEYAVITASSAGTDDGSGNYEFVIGVSGGWSEDFVTSSGYTSSGNTSSTAKIATSPKKYVGLIYDTAHSSNSQYSDKFVLGHWSADLDTASDAGDADGRMALGVGMLDVSDAAAFGSSVSVTGDIYGSASANITGTVSAASISQNSSSGSLSVLGAASFSNTAEFDGTVTLNNADLKVENSSGDAMVTLAAAGTVFVEGAITASGLNSDGNVALSAGADFGMVDGSNNSVFTVAGASGNTAIAGTLAVTGVGSFTDTISAASGSSIGNLTLADGSITDTSGAISFGDENLSTSGTLASSDLTVTGTASVSGAATMSSTLSVTGAATLSSTLSAGASTLASATISGAASVGGTLGVTGAATLSSSLDVTGAVGIDGDFDINTDKFTVASASGNTAIAGTLDVTGAATLSSSLSVTGALSSADSFESTGQATIKLGSGESFLIEQEAAGADLFKVDQAGDLTMGTMSYDTSASTLAINSLVSLNGTTGLISGSNLSVGSGTVTQSVAKLAERTSAPSSASGYGFLYVKDDGDSSTNTAELYYMDGVGAEIKITEDGSLNLDSIDISLDEAYNDGRSITADEGTVMITRAAGSSSYKDSALHLHVDAASSSEELANSEPMLQMDVTAGAYTAALNGIKVDFSGASSLNASDDAKGIELKGIANGGSNTDSYGLVVDSKWDVQAQFGDSTGGSDVRIVAGSSDEGALNFYAGSAAAAYVKFDGSESEFLIGSQNHELVIESGSGDLYLETSGELSVVPQLDAESSASWSAGDILCFGAAGKLQAADKSSADVGGESCPIGVAMGASSLTDNSMATVHGSVVEVSTSLGSLDNGTALYLDASGAVSDTPSATSGDEVWRVGFVFDANNNKMIWMPQFIMSNP